LKTKEAEKPKLVQTFSEAGVTGVQIFGSKVKGQG